MSTTSSALTNIYTNKPNAIAVNRIQYDIEQIRNDSRTLDIENIHFHFNNDDKITTTYYQLLIGPDDTPYQGGFYIFKAMYPDNYPFKPMTMKSITQGEGIRKHPNLYVCGKCCFSFLGTWSGPPWTACNNARSVAFSMRSVMTKYPLENEPGHEDVKAKKSMHIEYARLIEYFNLKYAVCNIMENLDKQPKSYFKKPIINYFKQNYHKYELQLQSLISYFGKSCKAIKSPVYGFTAKYDIKYVSSWLNKLKQKYIVEPVSFDCPIFTNVHSSETNKVPKVSNGPNGPNGPNEEVIVNTNADSAPLITENTSVKDTKPVKKIYKRQAPDKLASSFKVGHIELSLNDNCKYIVRECYRTSKMEAEGSRCYKRWFKYKD